APAERHPSILTAPTMFQVASEIGTLLREVIARARAGGMEGEEGDVFSASLIVAGQIKGMEPQVFRLYPEGNFIEASFDTPFFQI
ncbi:peptidase, partial [Acinetobacter baumannii]